MIVVIKDSVTPEGIDAFCQYLAGRGVDTHVVFGARQTIVGLLGDTSAIDPQALSMREEVASVKRISEAYKLVHRRLHPDDTVINVNGVLIGGGHFVTMAGPCSVESEEQVMAIAKSVKESGAQIFRGGAYKPRTSPYMFQGLGEDGLKLLSQVKREYGLPIVSEIMDARDLELFEDIDILQVGARNMQNFTLLKELGRCNKPVLLKRGSGATLDELLLSAEYILSEGNTQVMLCERGIRTFETRTRNTFDVSAIPVLRELTHLPVIADPSHATGYARFVSPVTCAAVAAGADGLEIEVHCNPASAESDGIQALQLDEFATLMRRVDSVKAALAL